jgi:hypothetical protein
VEIDRAGTLHLTYCTNIHPADGWDAVHANLRRVAPALKSRLSPGGRFGIGLRLSAREATELLAGRALDEFRAFLDAEGLYVALINGFPYGPFHGTPVKAEVYAPDWRDDARVKYTLNLIKILGELVPEGVDGGVSTAPLSYKPWVRADDRAAWETITKNVARVAEALIRLRRERGTIIHLDIEPEPDCLLETSDETVQFFERWLLPIGAAELATTFGMSADEARAHLLEHVRVCFDCCHCSVEYEAPRAALARLAHAGIQVGRVQLSSALDVAFPSDRAEAARLASRLQPFADPVYLHQVIERADTRVRQFHDLDQALVARQQSSEMSGDDAARQWRIHFHVPLFTSAYEGLGSTQQDVRTVIQAAQQTPFTRHLEIETYTWDVLPKPLKLDVVSSIAREYEWVLGVTRELRN